MKKKSREKRKNRGFRIITSTVFILLCVVITISAINNFTTIPNKPIKNGSNIGITTLPLRNNNELSQSQDNPDWNLLLVNMWNPIPDNYTVTLKTLRNGYQVDERIYTDLQEMFDAARNTGLHPLIGEAYRTADQQQKLLRDKINAHISDGYSKSEAETLAQTWVAVPRTSEHQLGLAVDINAEKGKSTNEEVYQWLIKNSYKYGFILRYPANKIEITGTNYEPWHYRYVGKEAAKEMYAQGVCLEEYIYNRQNRDP